MKERELNLLDLMVEILLCWREIIVWMLMGGLLMGVFSYTRSVQTITQQKDALEQQYEQKKLVQFEEILTSMQKNNVLAVLNYEDFQDYYNHSLLMQIDAANVPKTELVFWVKADSLEQSYNIRRLYETTLVNGMSEWLTEDNLEQKINLSELITVISKNKDETGNNSFFIQIIHLTEEECVDLADQVEEYIDFLHTQFITKIEPHDIILVNRSFAKVMDVELLNRQRTLVTNLTTSNTTAAKLLNEFSEDEQEYYNLMKAKKVSEENREEEEGLEKPSVFVANASVSVKHIFLGMVLFAFIYVFYLFMKYILNNKLRATDNIREIYDIPQLGCIPQDIPHKKFLGFVDGWVLKLRHSNKRFFPEEESIGLAAVAVKMAVKKESMREVFCVGCEVNERSQKIAEQIQAMLKEENITMKILSNVLYDQEALERLSSAKCVFLLETAGGTFYDEIAKEQELLMRQGIKILGGIIVG